MVSKIQQVKQELEALEQTVAETADQLQTTYDDYLDLLGNSAEKQLILAVYQLCTQIYAESFLKLSFSQRQKLQEKLRKVGKQIKPQLKKKYQPSKSSQNQADLSLIAEMLKNLPLTKMGQPSNTKEKQDEEQTHASDINSSEIAELIAKNGLVLENGRAIVIDGNQVISIEKQSLDDDTNIEDDNNESDNDSFEDKDSELSEEINLNDPQNLIAWQKNIENQIAKTLENISKKANKILQEADLISKQLPTKIMDIALHNADSSSRINKVKNIPNILNLVIEIDKGSKSKTNHNFGDISLLRLNLLEIEFVDSILSSKRNEIRNLMKKIFQIYKIYQERKHEYAMAEADVAWRSSWYQD